jgi:hypothetical protein
VEKAEFVLKDGTILTPKVEKQLADEAEAGYDLSKARRVLLRPGRPAKGQPTGESPRVAVRVPKDVYALARQRARAEGRTLSTVLRELIAQYAGGDRVA